VIEIFAAACIVLVLAGLVTVVTRLRSDEAAPATAPAVAPVALAPTVPAKGIVGALGRRRWLRRGLSFTSLTIGLVAIGVLGYPFYTNLYADRVQARLEREFASADLAQDYTTCREQGTASESCNIGEGDSLTRIIIPAIDIDVVVVEGTSASALRAGAGHYASTPLPCEPGNVAIAGHRTTYGRPFHNLDLLEPGDEITLETPVGACRYAVTETFIVQPDNVSVIAPTTDQRLTLTTCNPKGSARERLIVTAELVQPLDLSTA
jgi:sortase A